MTLETRLICVAVSCASPLAASESQNEKKSFDFGEISFMKAVQPIVNFDSLFIKKPSSKLNLSEQ